MNQKDPEESREITNDIKVEGMEKHGINSIQNPTLISSYFTTLSYVQLNNAEPFEVRLEVP